MSRVLILSLVAVLTGCASNTLPAPKAMAPQVTSMTPPAAPAVINKDQNVVDPAATQLIDQPAPATQTVADAGFVPVKSPISSTHLEPVKERIFYYGPSVENGVKLDPSREFLKIKDASYNAADESRVSAPVPMPSPAPAVGSGDAPAAAAPTLITMRRVLSGSTEPRDGFFRALGVHDDSLVGRRKAEALMAHISGYIYTQGLLVWDDSNGWGWFTPTEIEH